MSEEKEKQPIYDKSFDPYFMAYHIYSSAMKGKNMIESITKTLYFTKICFDADNVILYEQNEQGDYVHKYNSAMMNSSSSLTTSILNYSKDAIADKKIIKMNLNDLKLDIPDLDNVAFIPVQAEDKKYVVALTGVREFKNLEDSFIDIFRDTMSEVLAKLEMFNSLTKTSEVDTLTGLNNRNSYEYDISEKQVNEGMIYAIFDLFRLKSVNDNYSHQKGDEYIKKTAEILDKYFPKYYYANDVTGKKTKMETGTNLYRVGGDEFVLVSNNETYNSALIRIRMAQEEIKNMDLGINEPLMINFGLVKAGDGDTFRDLYLRSDMLLSENKRVNYQTLGLDRRK